MTNEEIFKKYNLNAREQKIYLMTIDMKKIPEIAHKGFYSISQVKYTREAICKKMGFKNPHNLIVHHIELKQGLPNV